MLLALCVCAEIPRLQTTTRLVLLLHFREDKKPTNTGRLAALALSNSEVHVRGLPDELIDLRITGRAAVLYPSDDATILTPSEAPLTLIVPDGSWRQASKMPRREPMLRDLPRVKLPGVELPSLKMRRETTAFGMSTLAAIAHAIDILDGQGAPLLALDRLVAERTLKSRGRS
jgi:DTW domain-containing protein YfiP